MSDQPTLPQRLNDERPLLRFTDDLDLWHLGYIANAVDAGQLVPVEPVTFVAVDREGGAITYDRTDLFDLPSGRYAIVPLEADDE